MKRLNQIVNKFNIYNVAASKFALFKCSSATHAGDLVLFDDWGHSKNEPVVRPVKVLDK
jgi:hypothetical protein